MSSGERRFTESEVEAIFERATSDEAARALPPSTPSAPSDGLTLSELQDIGTQVGIPPERIAEAAQALAARVPSPAPLTFLGAPRSVSRIVRLPRALTDTEWGRLVADLRQTFAAQGRIQAHGALRSWSNGNLQVHVEPDGTGFRLRMQTLRGDTYSRVFVGGTALLMSGVLALENVREGGLVMAAAIGLAGLGQLVYLRLSLPRWAATRAAQMDAIAERVQRLLEDPALPPRVPH
jgi:hypothetical protein